MMPERSGRNRRPRADMAADRALDILSCLEAHGVVVWFDGGWGVDAHLGQQTRAHDDLDVIVEINQVVRLVAALNHLGYETVRGAPPTCFEMVDSEGHEVDVHPVTLCNVSSVLASIIARGVCVIAQVKSLLLRPDY